MLYNSFKVLYVVLYSTEDLYEHMKWGYIKIAGKASRLHVRYIFFFWYYLFHLWVISRASGSEPPRHEPCIVTVRAVFLEPKNSYSTVCRNSLFFYEHMKWGYIKIAGKASRLHVRYIFFFWYYLFHLWVISRASGSEPPRHEPCIVTVRAVFLEPKNSYSTVCRNSLFFLNNK